jgi:putative addiction module killer protein
MVYSGQQIVESDVFRNWLSGLRDRRARARIHARLRRLSLGNPGDVKAVGGGISELRVDYGPGYRVYFQQRGPRLVVLLIGGDKRTQATDIRRAQAIAADWSE